MPFVKQKSPSFDELLVGWGEKEPHLYKDCEAIMDAKKFLEMKERLKSFGKCTQ